MEDKGFEKYYAESSFLQNQHLFWVAPDCNPLRQIRLKKRSIYVKQYSLWDKISQS